MAVGTVSGLNLDEEWQLIGSQAMNGLNTYTFSSLTGYKTYWLVGKGLTHSVADIDAIRLNGDTSSASYGNYWSAANGIGQFVISPSTTNSHAFSFKIYNTDKSVPHKIESSYYDTVYLPSSGEAYTDPTLITSITIKAYNNNNYTGGTVYLYGIAA